MIIKGNSRKREAQATTESERLLFFGQGARSTDRGTGDHRSLVSRRYPLPLVSNRIHFLRSLN